MTEPDEFVSLRVDRRQLPNERTYRTLGVEKRQAQDIVRDTDGQAWAKAFHYLLLGMHQAVDKAGGALPADDERRQCLTSGG